MLGYRIISTTVLTAALLCGCSQKAPQAKGSAASAQQSTPTAGDDAPKVKLSTTMGDIVLQLDRQRAPKSVANFLQYVKDGHYNGTIFHRVISSFMIQGGGFTADMQKKPTRAPIQNEADNGLKNDRGTIAMARTGAPHSATAQFFINVVNNDMLNHRGKNMRGWGYTVFGKVIAGMDVVDKIRNVPTERKGMHGNVPTTTVVINSATVVK